MNGDVARKLGDRRGEAMALSSLGYAHHHLGHRPEAIAGYHRALALLRELGDQYDEALTLSRLGDTHADTADPEAARDAWRRALAILDLLAGPDAERIRAKLAGLGSP